LNIGRARAFPFSISIDNSAYGDSLQAGLSGVQFPVGTRYFSYFIKLHTCPGAHPASLQWVSRLFPGVKYPGRGVDTPPTSTDKIKNEYSTAVLPTLFPMACYRNIMGFYEVYLTML